MRRHDFFEFFWIDVLSRRDEHSVGSPGQEEKPLFIEITEITDKQSVAVTFQGWIVCQFIPIE